MHRNSTTTHITNMRSGGDVTRRMLLLEALKLFTSKPYDKVTYSDLENASGLSRGAILYHIKNKETLFRDVVKMFVFGNNTLTSLEEAERSSLIDTINNFVDRLAAEQKEWMQHGIDNINFALVNIQMSSYTLFPDSLSYAREWYKNEVSIWQEVIAKAIEAGEIRNVDPTMFAEIFEECYLGAAYAGLPADDGYNPERLRHKLHCIYAAIS